MWCGPQQSGQIGWWEDVCIQPLRKMCRNGRKMPVSQGRWFSQVGGTQRKGWQSVYPLGNLSWKVKEAFREDQKLPTGNFWKTNKNQSRQSLPGSWQLLWLMPQSREAQSKKTELSPVLCSLCIPPLRVSPCRMRRVASGALPHCSPKCQPLEWTGFLFFFWV